MLPNLTSRRQGITVDVGGKRTRKKIVVAISALSHPMITPSATYRAAERLRLGTTASTDSVGGGAPRRRCWSKVAARDARLPSPFSGRTSIYTRVRGADRLALPAGRLPTRYTTATVSTARITPTGLATRRRSGPSLSLSVRFVPTKSNVTRFLHLYR